MSFPLLYHEKQVAALCGVHCINALLQGPIFNEVDLAQIAHELDAMERAFMAEGGMTSDEYLRFTAEESGNVAADGMFSIQVLSKALQVWGLHAIPIDNPEVRAAATEPQREEAFICNLQEHWFTIRKMECDAEGVEWWNFNSLFPAPQPLGTFYLSAFLATLREQGYQIFVIRGNLPAPQRPPSDGSGAVPGGAGRWFTPSSAKQANDTAAEARQRGRVSNALEEALSRAQAQGGTLQLRSKRSRLQDAALVNDDEDADLAAAIAASLADQPGGSGSGRDGAGPSGAGPSTSAAPAPSASMFPDLGLSGGDPPLQRTSSTEATVQSSGELGLPEGLDYDEDEDPELAMAIAASLADSAAGGQAHWGGEVSSAARGAPAAAAAAAQEGEVLEEEPDAGPGVVELAFRLPGGQRSSRRFHVTDTTAALHRYLRLGVGLRGSPLSVSTQFPRKDLLPSATTTLAEAGVSDPQVLVVTDRAA